MALILGLDTGGTYTDAAILDAATGAVLARAKAPTTRHDLAIGLGDSIHATIAELTTERSGSAADIRFVALSTTLATNAVVEGMGGRVGLVMIGFGSDALSRNNLDKVMASDPVMLIAGGHGSDGTPQAALDETALEHFASQHGSDIGAIAIAGHFATRNPEHEQRARDRLRQLTGLPTTCSHELSSALGGPKRAVTAVLNARLISLLDRQITATQTILSNARIDAKLMVVKGDGSLVSADFARLRPVETILSGPAASVSGAAHLASASDAIIADIGGTTTDIAVLEGGWPRLSAEGARIGGWSTMVEAAEIRTTGLGGDSEVRLKDRGVRGGLTLGPRRVIPISALAQNWPDCVKLLEGQLANPVAADTDARFVLPLDTTMEDASEPKQPVLPDWLTRVERRVAENCYAVGPAPLASLAETRLARNAIDRLVARGLLRLAAFTPTDAAHILGSFTAFDRQAAILAGKLMARQRTGAGKPQATDETAFARMTCNQLTRQSALALMDSSIAHEQHLKESRYAGLGEAAASNNPLVAALLDSNIGNPTGKSDDKGLISMQISLGRPLIALGASAACHYPAIADALNANLVIPDDAAVAGAIGAAAGSIRQRTSITITMPSDGLYRVHDPAGHHDFKTLEPALSLAEQIACTDAETKAMAAGASAVKLSSSRHISQVKLGGGKELFLEAVIHGLAEGQL